MTPRTIALILLIILAALVFASWDIIRNQWQERQGPGKWWVLAGCLALLIAMVVRTITPVLREFFS